MTMYSMDLRRRVLVDCAAGSKTKPLAEKYSVSRTGLRSVKQRRRRAARWAGTASTT